MKQAHSTHSQKADSQMDLIDPEHVFIWRVFCGVPYQHHGIDLGDGTVVHFGQPQVEDRPAEPGLTVDESVPEIRERLFETKHYRIHRISRETFLKSAAVHCELQGGVHIVKHATRLKPETIRERVLERIGQGEYALLTNNCEHFATWCVTGESDSRQVTHAIQRTAAVLLKTATLIGARVGARAQWQLLVAAPAAKLICRSAASPWSFASEVVQSATEVGGHHVGLSDPKHRTRVGQGLGAITAAMCGIPGGPAGMLTTTSIWAAGELAAIGWKRLSKDKPSLAEPTAGVVAAFATAVVVPD